MTQLTVKVEGAELVRKGLEDLAAELPQIGRRQIFDMMNRITRNLEGYPSERPGQKYVRTGRLGFGWQVARLDDGYTVENATPYTKYVHGDAYGTGQAWMHEGRWPLLRDVVDEEVEKLPDLIEQHIVMVARRDGLDAS